MPHVRLHLVLEWAPRQFYGSSGVTQCPARGTAPYMYTSHHPVPPCTAISSVGLAVPCEPPSVTRHWSGPQEVLWPALSGVTQCQAQGTTPLVRHRQCWDFTQCWVFFLGQRLPSAGRNMGLAILREIAQYCMISKDCYRSPCQGGDQLTPGHFPAEQVSQSWQQRGDNHAA